jgi:hypothetical protein
MGSFASHTRISPPDNRYVLLSGQTLRAAVRFLPATGGCS